MNTQVNNNNVGKQKPVWWHALHLPNASRGSLVEGTVVLKKEKSLYVDLGELGSGIVWGREFSDSENTIKPLKEGDRLKAKIVSLNNEKGLIELSLKEADKEMGWKWIKEAAQKGKTIAGKVISANRGGLVLQAGSFQGFLPTSQMSQENFPKVENGNKERILQELNKLTGKEILVKIADFSARDGKIIFSEKKIEEEKEKKILEEKYNIGDVVEGKILEINPTGAFFQIKGDEKTKGFIPVSEASWQPLENISDLLDLKKEYSAKITGFRSNEVRLSLKALESDPWLEKIKNYQVGQKIKGGVHKFIPLGALVKIEENVYGFIHSSELGGLEEMKSKLAIGESHDFSIEAIKEDEKRIDLKLA